MKPGEVRICPSCQARNKGKWEFCVRCGESLQDVPLESQQQSKKPVASTRDEAPQQGYGPLFFLSLVAGLGVLGAVTASTLHTEPARPAVLTTAAGVSGTSDSSAPTQAPAPSVKDHVGTARALLAKGDTAGAIDEATQALA